jgi:outer membrane protein OmpA-like peptidoglycan-associated protein
MLKKILMASAAVMLLAACEQQQTQAVTAPPAPPPAPTQNYFVYFNPGQAMLSPESSNTVLQAADAFKAGGASVSITGHADTTGDSNSNLQLSQHRAAAVKDGLVRNGVPAASIQLMGNGEEGLPVQTADNVSERRNRSVDIVIAKRPMLTDSEYCNALSVAYRHYRQNQIDEVAAQAMSKCPTADAVNAIPVLEQHLNQNNLALPSRYRS